MITLMEPVLYNAKFTLEEGRIEVEIPGIGETIVVRRLAELEQTTKVWIAACEAIPVESIAILWNVYDNPNRDPRLKTFSDFAR